MVRLAHSAEQSRGWGFKFPRLTINFRMPTEFVLISFSKPDVRKNLKINFSGYVK